MLQRQRYLVRLKGTTALLHHRMTDEEVLGLMGDKGVKTKVKIYKTPREVAAEHAYQREDGVCYIPTGYVVNALIHVSADYKQKNSQRRSYKGVLGGLFMPEEDTADLLDLENNPIKHFEVDLRKGNNFPKGAIACCRPRFDQWETEFTVKIHTDLLTPETALIMLNDAGVRSGIGSYRVSKNGWFGQFTVTKFEELKNDL